MKKVELLAPAKNKQTAFAAINSGCDAIYIGASSFGARKKVGNSLKDIKEIVEYAHKFYVKVHVTVNTILDDRELLEAQNLIEELYDIGVDAIIVQDMGIFELAIEGKLPPIALHASTQCDNRSLDKVKFFKKVVASRVILARELSMEQIKEICDFAQAEGLEIETFVHGALCVSYSGQCYMSYYIGGRSANRGECAQVCRKKYTLIDENKNIIAKDKYLLSMKDFNASKHLKDLIDIGVKSFKIEGRLKDLNYVKNVVAYYRKEIDKYAAKTSSGKIFINFTPDVRKSFNRGFTDYFLTGRTKCFNLDSPKSLGEKIGKISKVGKNYFEINWSKNYSANILHAQDGLYFDGFGCLVNKIEGEKIYPNKMNGITKGVDIYRNYDSKFEKQLEISKIKRQIGVKFIFENNILRAIDENGNSVQLNISNEEEPKNYQKMEDSFINQLQKTGESDFYVEKIDLNSKIPFIPISQINEIRRQILAMLMEERLKNYQREIQKPLKYSKYIQENLGYKANIFNNMAKCFYENCGCKVCEMALETKTPKLQTVELMHTKHCIKYALNMCKSPKKLYLVDEKGEKYPLKFDCKNCEMYVLNK